MSASLVPVRTTLWGSLFDVLLAHDLIRDFLTDMRTKKISLELLCIDGGFK